MATADILRGMLLYFILPLWLAAGFADYLCHRASHIETSSGWKESLLHLLQFTEIGVPLVAALALEINTGVILLMIVCLVLHHATAMWDVHYANGTREVMPIEQHIHSVLEMLPLTAVLMVIALNWTAFLGLFGLAPAEFAPRLKDVTLPWTYIVSVLGAALLFEILPYLEELWRGLRAKQPTKGAVKQVT
jgi:hypothetical protein